MRAYQLLPRHLRRLAGMGDTGSGETLIEGDGLPTDGSVDFSSGEMGDPSLFLPEPGYNLPTAPLDTRAASASANVKALIAKDSAAWAAAVTGKQPETITGERVARFGTPTILDNKPLIIGGAIIMLILAIASSGGRRR